MPRSRLHIYLAGLCAAALTAKFLLIWRINVNWDEFFYMSHVFAFARGESVRLLQQAYVHLFTWLADFGQDEMDQILAARVVMWSLLVATVVLMAKLASRWVTPAIAWFAPLAYFAVAPVLRHSASFRSDTMLALLAIATLVVLTSPTANRRHYLLAGCLFGVSVVLSLKAFLLLPLFIAVAVTSPVEPATAGSRWLRHATLRCISLGTAAAATAAIILLLHRLSMPVADSGSIQGLAVGAARKTLLDVPLFPRWDYLRASLTGDWPSWLLIGGGLAVSLVTRSRAALCALSLLPVVFYRNAFPYYYAVMLAPASILAAVGIQGALDAARSAATGSSAPSRQALIAAAISLPLILQTALEVAELSYDRQVMQRRTIAAVHHIFSKPVPYFDHSGMIASFPKANFFMSSWGMDNYLERGTSFVGEAIDRVRPPLLLANTPVLLPGAPQSAVLLEQDLRLIESSYLPYWGIIMVAGTEVSVAPSAAEPAVVPFPGRYRIETDGPVLVNGARVESGAIVTAESDGPGLRMTVRNDSTEPMSVRFVWAEANPELPTDFPPYLPVYSAF